jgi:hypothetical protein
VKAAAATRQTEDIKNGISKGEQALPSKPCPREKKEKSIPMETDDHGTQWKSAHLVIKSLK